MKITKEMIVREVTTRWPETISVFGNHRVDFCCGGAHCIEETARARGCKDVEALIADLNQAIASQADSDKLSKQSTSTAKLSDRQG